MSTTFDIIPTEKAEITFGQVLETSEKNINAFLNSIGIEQIIRLKINLHENNFIPPVPMGFGGGEA